MQPYICNSPLQTTDAWLEYFTQVLEELFEVIITYQKPNYSSRLGVSHPFFQTSAPIQIPYLGISNKIVIFPRGFDILDQNFSDQYFDSLVLTPQLCRMLDNKCVLPKDQYTESPVRTEEYVCESERRVGEWLSNQGIDFRYNPKLKLANNTHKTVDFWFPNPVNLSIPNTNYPLGLIKMIEVKGGPVKPQDLDRAYQILQFYEGPYCFMYWQFIQDLKNTC